MVTAQNPLRRRATEMLLLATLCWGISFPVMKAMGMVHQRVLGHENSWFATASAVTVRFGVAALILFAWNWRSWRQFTRLEIWQGFGLGMFAGMGMLFQVDGLAYTSASSSAFLTQCGCVFLPWLVALRDRRWPSPLMVGCSFLAMSGVAVLADMDWRQFRLGRGELETLISSMIFTAQILWLERPVFAGNKVSHFTLVMFTTMALTTLPVALLSMERSSDWLAAYRAPSVWLLIAVLVIFCTLIAFVLMNRWQRVLPAPEAGLIYAAEPVFASLFALFLPAWLSLLVLVGYANESVTISLLVGGGLITLANILIQVAAARAPAAHRGVAETPLGRDRGAPSVLRVNEPSS